MSPKVSVIIPCYGVEKYLDKCVESVIAQTLTDLEIILVDDESPDRVPQMCDAWALKDKRIKVVHKKNGGLGMACNSGLEVATGKYVAFLDSDDWVDKKMYLSMFEVAEKHQAQMVFTGLKQVDIEGKEIGHLTHKTQFKEYHGKEEIDSLACDMVASDVTVAQERTLQMSAKVVLYNHETIEKNHIRFVSERKVMSEDLHFNLNVLSHSKCVCVMPDFFYNYRCTDGSITRKLDLNQFKKIKTLYTYTCKESKYLGIGGNIQQRVQRMFIGYTRNYIRTICRSKTPTSQQNNIIRGILNDSIWNDLFTNYPIESLPFYHRIFIKLMQRKQVKAIRFLLKYK